MQVKNGITFELFIKQTIELKFVLFLMVQTLLKKFFMEIYEMDLGSPNTKQKYSCYTSCWLFFPIV